MVGELGVTCTCQGNLMSIVYGHLYKGGEPGVNWIVGQ